MKVGLALTVINQMVKQSSDTIIGVYDTVQVSTIAVVVPYFALPNQYSPDLIGLSIIYL